MPGIVREAARRTKRKTLWSALAAAETVLPNSVRFGQHQKLMKLYQAPTSDVQIECESIVVPKNLYRNAGSKQTGDILKEMAELDKSSKKFKRPLSLTFNNLGLNPSIRKNQSPTETADTSHQAHKNLFGRSDRLDSPTFDRKKPKQKPRQFTQSRSFATIPGSSLRFSRPFSTSSAAWATKPMPSLFNKPLNGMATGKNRFVKRPPVTDGAAAKNSGGFPTLNKSRDQQQNKNNKPPVAKFGSAFGGNKGPGGPKKTPQRPPQQRDRAPRRDQQPVKAAPQPVVDNKEVLVEFLKSHQPEITSYVHQAILDIYTSLQENQHMNVIYVSETGDLGGKPVPFMTLVKDPKLDLANKSLKLVKQDPAMVKTQSLPSYVTPKYQLENLTKEEKAAMKADYKAQRKLAKAEEKQKKKVVENNRNLLEIHSTWSINLRDLRQQKFRKLSETLKEGRPAVVSFASKQVRNAMEAKRFIEKELLSDIDRERRQLLVSEVQLLAEECGVQLQTSGSIDLLYTMTLKP